MWGSKITQTAAIDTYGITWLELTQVSEPLARQSHSWCCWVLCCPLCCPCGVLSCQSASLPHTAGRVQSSLKFEQRQNPHGAHLPPMKLFNRAEVRDLAHRRHGCWRQMEASKAEVKRQAARLASEWLSRNHR